MSLLTIQVHQKKFAERAILTAIDLTVEGGQVVSLIGASGCGKSTLLRIISGLELEYQGQISLGGKIITNINQSIGFIFQEPRLLPWLNVADNIAFAAEGKPDYPYISSLLEEVGLSGYEQALPKSLSGGQAQRVAIARGLYRRPKILLLDEPFSAVDAFTRIRLQDLLTHIALAHHITLILVTHDVDEAVFLSDRVIVIGNQPGTVTADLAINVLRPRKRESPELLKERAIVFNALQAAHIV